MMATDFECTAGRNWHVRIDEVPSATAAGEFTIPALSRYFKAAYDLAPIPGTTWSRVSLRGDAPSTADMMRDDLGKGLTAFHKRAKSPHGVFVNLADSRDARQRSRPVRWWSAWTPMELSSSARSPSQAAASSKA
jgi:hypothetical protein